MLTMQPPRLELQVSDFEWKAALASSSMYFDTAFAWTWLAVVHIHVLFPYNSLPPAVTPLTMLMCAAKAFPALLQHSLLAVKVTGLPRKAAVSYFVCHHCGEWTDLLRSKSYCLCVSLCSSSLVWDNDSHPVKCAWIKAVQLSIAE